MTSIAESIVFIDSEIGASNQKIADLGAVKENNARFHSPSIRDFSAFIADAAELIESGGVEPNRIAKTVLVIDEAQDMDENEFRLIRALMKRNDEMRVIAVGDDDQNIYEFRGSDSKYMRTLIQEFGAVQYEMTENFRSRGNVVALANAFVHSIGMRMKTADIQAVQQKNGIVQITRCTGGHLEQPVAEQIVKTYHGGSACVLTNTNEEAFRVLSLLTSLENCLNLIADFEQVNSYGKYRSDLEEFIRGSRYEDFYSDDRETVFISTIHKAKGREFDSVYLLLDHVSLQSDADRRKLYVGLTRAKNNLYIHCNTDIFDTYQIPAVEKQIDPAVYSGPEEITLPLTHRDVVLDFFKGKKAQLLRLHSGSPLELDREYLTARMDGKPFRAAKLSKACVAKLGELRGKGYRPVSAEVRFVVAWKGKEDDRETAVLLADIRLSSK